MHTEAALSVRVLALDLERTLIDDSMSARPRPCLRDFLMFCQEKFERVALFTTVEEADAREVLQELARGGHVPLDLLARLEFIAWSGEYKDLMFIPNVSPADVLLVDDDAGWVHPDQRGQWVPIAAWDGGSDNELRRVQSELEGWLNPKVTSSAPPT
jgi:hypothetical protein